MGRENCSTTVSKIRFYELNKLYNMKSLQYLIKKSVNTNITEASSKTIYEDPEKQAVIDEIKI